MTPHEFHEAYPGQLLLAGVDAFLRVNSAQVVAVILAPADGDRGKVGICSGITDREQLVELLQQLILNIPNDPEVVASVVEIVQADPGEQFRGPN